MTKKTKIAIIQTKVSNNEKLNIKNSIDNEIEYFILSDDIKSAKKNEFKLKMKLMWTT